MRYLEKFNWFKKEKVIKIPIYEPSTEISKVDIEDISLELEDLGFKFYIERPYTGDSLHIYDEFIGSSFIIFQKEDLTTKWSDIKDCILRLKDYLGNRYVTFRCSTFYKGRGVYNTYSTLDENTKIKGKINYINIEYKTSGK